MKYLIAGKNGQLARAFIKKFEEKGIDFLAPDESYFDITDSDRVIEVVDSYKPDVIINCAAYNLVDGAEQESDIAFKVNASGPKILAAVSERNKTMLVHFGSDYVFDGTKENGLYNEDDVTNPLNEYGKSKLSGEKLIQQETDEFLIFRLSWVFGEGKQNFIYKLTEWSKNNEFLRIACDEFSVPTYTDTVGDITMRALDKGITGLYHLTNTGFCSRYEWANLILRSLGINKFIRPVSMDMFNLPAKRPKFSAMSNTKISKLLNVDIPGWEEGVISFLKHFKSFR
jgi:dTDP-4-dehydrorhamnose reductase